MLAVTFLVVVAVSSLDSSCLPLSPCSSFRELARLSDTPLKHYEQRPFHDERVTQIMKLGVRPDAMKAAHAFVNLGDKRATLADEKAVLKRLRECKDIEEELAAIKKKVCTSFLVVGSKSFHPS